MSPRRRILFSFAALVAVYAIGSTGYYVLQEDTTFLDAAYMTVITISTVGYREVIELDAIGRLWTMFVILFGVGTFSLAFSSFLAALVSGEIRANREKRRMQAIIDNLKDHVIVCGYGRVGSLATADLIRKSIPVVVIESNDRVIRDLEENQVPYVNGNATEDDTLEKAGLSRARFLITTLPSDADNVYVTLSARGLRPDLHILARAEQADAQVKLRRAGANHVVCPQTIGASRLAALIAHPHVVEFVEVAAKGVELEISEYLVGADSSVKGKTLRESDLRRKAGGIVVAIKRAEGETLFNPEPDEPIREKDTLVIIGTSGISNRLDAMSV